MKKNKPTLTFFEISKSNRQANGRTSIRLQQTNDRTKKTERPPKMSDSDEQQN